MASLNRRNTPQLARKSNVLRRLAEAETIRIGAMKTFSAPYSPCSKSWIRTASNLSWKTAISESRKWRTSNETGATTMCTQTSKQPKKRSANLICHRPRKVSLIMLARFTESGVRQDWVKIKMKEWIIISSSSFWSSPHTFIHYFYTKTLLLFCVLNSLVLSFSKAKLNTVIYPCVIIRLKRRGWKRNFKGGSKWYDLGWMIR